MRSRITTAFRDLINGTPQFCYESRNNTMKIQICDKLTQRRNYTFTHTKEHSQARCQRCLVQSSIEILPNELVAKLITY